MRWRSRRFGRSRKPGFLSFVVIIVIIFLLVEGVFFLERQLRPSVVAIASVKADILATNAINEAVLEKMTEDTSYKEIIDVEKNNNGDIVMAQLNSMEVNRLLSETTIATQRALKKLEKKEPIKIPIGEAMDNYLLATYGPGIPVRLIPMGRVNTRLEDSFEEAGINQVRHKVYLEVDTEIQIVVPFVSAPVEVVTTVPIADTIYPGEVPETVIDLDLSRGAQQELIP